MSLDRRAGQGGLEESLGRAGLVSLLFTSWGAEGVVLVYFFGGRAGLWGGDG